MNTVTGNIDIVKVSMNLTIISTHYASYAKIKSGSTKHFLTTGCIYLCFE